MKTKLVINMKYTCNTRIWIAVTVVPIEAFRKMLTNSFPNLKNEGTPLNNSLKSSQLPVSLTNQILYFIFEQSDWSMKQEVRNFLRN